MTRRFVVVLVMAGFPFLAGCLWSQDPGGDFEVDLYTGDAVFGSQSTSFEAVRDLERPIVLNFFGGDCPPCVVELPRLEAAWLEHQADVVFLGVDVGPFTGLGTHVEGAALVADLGITFPTGSTPDSTVIPNWRIHGLPETFFIDSKGSVSSHWPGLITHSQLEHEIESMLK